MSFLNIIQSNGISYKTTGKQDEIRLVCPLCDSNFKLYLNVKKGRGICFRCGEGGGAWKFLEAAGCKRDDPAIPTLKLDISAQRKLPLIKKSAIPPEATILTQENDSELARTAAKYLIANRGLEWQDISDYALHYVSQGKFRGYIIMPVWNIDGEMVSWQARRFLFTGGKSLNPSDGGPGKSELLYNIHNVKQNDSVVIVEGPFDAIVAHRNLTKIGKDFSAVAILGHTMSRNQAAILGYAVHPQEAYIMYDPDAYAAQKETFFLLKSYGVKSKICRARVDPDELSPDELADCIYNSGNI